MKNRLVLKTEVKMSADIILSSAIALKYHLLNIR